MPHNLTRVFFECHCITISHVVQFSFSNENFSQSCSPCILYTAKLLSGKTFVIVHKMHYSLENFRGTSGRGHHVLYTASDSKGKLLRSTEKPQNRKSFPTRKFCCIQYFIINVVTTNTGVHVKHYLICKPYPIVVQLDVIATFTLPPLLTVGCFRPNCSYY